MTDALPHAAFKLGRKPERPDARTFKLKTFMATLPEVPKACDWAQWVLHPGMMRNDEIGLCVIAGSAHALQAWQAVRGIKYRPSDEEVVAAYVTVSGLDGTPYDPATGANDDGLVILDALRYWRSSGLWNTKIGAFAKVDHKDLDEVRAAIALFGGVIVGADLPNSAQKQKFWQVEDATLSGDAAPLSWGGHCCAPGTRVLTADLRWVPVELLSVGDCLVAFEEDGPRRRYVASLIEGIARYELPSIEMGFSDGTVIVVSQDHGFLARSNSKGSWEWRAACDLPLGSFAARPIAPWIEDTSRDAGYLAAAFDGEGWIDGESDRGIHKFGFAQRDNSMLARVQTALTERGFSYHRTTDSGRGFSKDNCERLTIHHRQQLLRFLGAIRPHRLLDKFSPDRVGQMHADALEVVGISPLGPQEVIGLKTSSRTFISEGIASHNCMFTPAYTPAGFTFSTWGDRQDASLAWWQAYVSECWAVLGDSWVRGDQPAPSGFDLPALQKALNAF